MLRRTLAAAIAFALLSAGTAGAAEPKLRTSPKKLAAGYHCPVPIKGKKTPIMLVTGTGFTGDEAYAIAKPAFDTLGNPVCYVNYPFRTTGDIQVSVEYLVYGIRRMSAMRGGAISIVGHSQGGTLPIYALRYWPDLARRVDDYVGLAPALNSPATGDVFCASSCTAPFQQLRSNSDWFESFSHWPLPAGASYTTIASRTDEIVFPQPQASHLDGATNVLLQDLCPAKVVDHFGMASDGAVYAIASDALTHPGAADTARLDPVATCTQQFLPGADPAKSSTDLATGATGSASAVQNGRQETKEPPVRCYMHASCADVRSRGRMLSSIRRRGSKLTLRAQVPGSVRVLVRGRLVRTVNIAGPSRKDLRVPTGPLVIKTRSEHYTAWARER
jgi:hypothetical protein